MRRAGAEVARGSSSTRHVGAATFWMGMLWAESERGAAASTTGSFAAPRLAGRAVPSIHGTRNGVRLRVVERASTSRVSPTGGSAETTGVAILVPRGAVTFRRAFEFSSSAAFATAAGTTSVVVVRTTS